MEERFKIIVKGFIELIFSILLTNDYQSRLWILSIFVYSIFTLRSILSPQINLTIIIFLVAFIL